MNIMMNPSAYWLATSLFALLAFAPLQDKGAAKPEKGRQEMASETKVRQAAVAGSFYPADPKVLSTMMDGYLAKVSGPPVTDPILAVVAPHAGYEYSGPVAAYTYAQLKGHKYTRVVIIAPSHYVAFDYSSIYDGDAYSTPLGNVPVDKAFARELVKMSSTMQLSSQGHDPTSAGGEHAIEVQLPWLQKVLGNFEIVPIVMGDQSYENSRALGVALARLIKASGKEGETLVLASSDLSHYHPYDDAETIDHKTLNALQAWDYFSMSRNFQSRIWEACGGAPIVAAMIYAERMGANQARVLKYANSGDVTGDKSRVVGYSADVFVKANGGKAMETPFKSVESVVGKDELYMPLESADARLNQERGAFVTLTIAGGLRGCIGYTAPIKPLYLTVRDTATHAALHDPRFPPVTAAELPGLAYEISVLSPLRRVTDLQQIRVGEHGLLMKNGDREGLLLPQVPVEQKWDRQTFLEQTCRKAGMDSGCWKDDDTDIFAFTAVVFHEQKP
jgi:hypothetical protein